MSEWLFEGLHMEMRFHTHEADVMRLSDGVMVRTRSVQRQERDVTIEMLADSQKYVHHKCLDLAVRSHSRRPKCRSVARGDSANQHLPHSRACRGRIEGLVGNDPL